MKTITNSVLFALLCYIISGCMVSCTSDDYQIESPNFTTNGTKTFSLKFNGNVNGYEDQSTRAGSETKSWKDGNTVFVKFVVNDTTFVFGAAEYKEKPNTWNITFKGNLPETTNGKCSVFFTDSIVSTSGDSLVNLSRHDGSYFTDDATYNFNGIEISINAIMSPLNGRIRFLGDSIESVKIVGITSLSSFNAKTFEFKTDTAEVMTNCAHANSDSTFYYTDYIYGMFTDSVKPSLYMESKEGTFRRSCNNVKLSSGSSGYIKCPQEDNYNGWTWFTGSETKVFSDAIDLGLSVLWSKRNLGAEYDYDYGYYTSWGDVDGSNTNTNSYYSNTNHWTPLSIDFTGLTSYDRSTKTLGEKWYTPSDKEWNELLTCNIRYTSKNGVGGYEITGKNGNTIFLPLAGRVSGTDTTFDGIASDGYYWSSSFGRKDWSSSNASYFYEGSFCWFNKSNLLTLGKQFMYYKCSIRPVMVK